MKEKIFINLIKSVLNSKYIGDDCAYLKDLGIVVSQDSLVEDVHFSRSFANAYQIGYKSVMVNISDICASGTEPKYLTIALSLPDSVDEHFVKDFYMGAKDAAGKVEIVGGDITGADKIYISVTAIGAVGERKISSRSSAKIGQKVVISGPHGSSGAGLRELMSGKREEDEFISAHLMPKARLDFSEKISSNIKQDYAMMDTSDGLMDALVAIAESSGVCLEIDFNKIPYCNGLKNFENWQDLIFFGGEDYELVATVPDNMDLKDGFVIGKVVEGRGVRVDYGNSSKFYTGEDIEKNLFNHFKE